MTYLGPHGEPIGYACAICGAIGMGQAPHGWSEPCPQKVAIDKAYIEKLDAERMYFVRGGLTGERVATAMDRIAGVDEDD